MADEAPEGGREAAMRRRALSLGALGLRSRLGLDLGSELKPKSQGEVSSYGRAPILTIGLL